MSANTDYYWNRVKDLENNPVDPYQSKYGTQIDSVLNKIVNRQPFSYDFNADPLYQNYKDQYTKLGNEASMNAVANASALTGGYGNSYAATAGAQANQQYLTQLNQVIPELYNAAMSKYQMEGDDLKDQYGLLGNAEDREYGRYRDTVNDYNNMLNYFQNAYGTQLGNDQWNANFDYQKQRDSVADSQWAAEMAYKNGRAAASDAQWKAEFDLKKAAQAAKDLAATQAQYDGSQTDEDKPYFDPDAPGIAFGNVYQYHPMNDMWNMLKTGTYDTGNTAHDTYNNVNAFINNGTFDDVARLKGISREEAAADYISTQVNSGKISEEEALEILDSIMNGTPYKRELIHNMQLENLEGYANKRGLLRNMQLEKLSGYFN